MVALDRSDVSLLLVLNLGGTFAFGLSGAMAAVKARLDVFGVVVLAVVVGLAGGVTRDVLIGVTPETVRDWRYIAAAVSAAVVTVGAHALLHRLARPVLALDAAGLALFCVTGAKTALEHGVTGVSAVVLGTITGVGGGVLRDILVGDVPVVLRSGLYAVPALIGATIVVVPFAAGSAHDVFLVVGAVVCFGIRFAGIHLDLNLPRVPRDPDHEP